MRHVVFVCTENANRSQMAEGFLRALAGGSVGAWSAGSRAIDAVNPRAVEAMAEKGIDLSAHRPTATHDLPNQEFDVAVSMGCGDQCPTLIAHRRESWDLPDPARLDDAGYRRVRDEIERRVGVLFASLDRPSAVRSDS